MVRYDSWKFADDPFPEAFAKGTELADQYFLNVHLSTVEEKIDALISKEGKRYTQKDFFRDLTGAPIDRRSRDIQLLIDQEFLGGMIVAIAQLCGKNTKAPKIHRLITQWLMDWSLKRDSERIDVTSIKAMPIFGAMISASERKSEWSHFSKLAKKTFYQK